MNQKVRNKIKTPDALARTIATLKKKDKKVVLCHGVFDIVHVGHIRHFSLAKKEGDILIVSTTKDRYVKRGPGRPVFNERLRIEMLASLDIVDYVSVVDSPTAIDFIKMIKPDVYAKGVEYKAKDKDVTGKIYDEEEAIKFVGGRLAFTDDVTFSSSSIINGHLDVFPPRTVKYLRAITKRYSIDSIVSSINNLKKPSVINEIFETIKPTAMQDVFTATLDPIEDVTPLKEGDIIDLNGLILEVFNFFGHTMDSIALLDEKNRNIFTGDAILNKSGDLYVQPTFMPPEFNESEILKTFQKLRDIKDKLNSIAIAHYGVYKDGDFEVYLEEMEEIHFKTKNSIIQWYKENLSSREIALKYYGTYVSSSEMLENEALDSLEMNIRWLIEGLKLSGFI